MESEMNLGTPLGHPAPWPAPAKLNLCLHIVGRRADGYHLLQSAIQFIDLCDEVRFWRRPAGAIERVKGPNDIPPESDLAIRAARLMAAQAAAPVGVGIELHKRIPTQAGLGGGSSDAATVLVALNRLWGLGLDVDQTAALGLQLGADVPMFVRGNSAWMEGVGEILTPTEFDPALYLVIKPDAEVATSDIFSAPELTRNTPVTTIRAFRQQGGHNDCTAAVRARHRQVAEALDWLGKFGVAKLTGTGACVFAACVDRAAAERILQQVPREWRGYVVQGLNESPLLARLQSEASEVTSS
jgi:4-diphosphocytidyl-2-C-methyl-D-erythritol kinase